MVAGRTLTTLMERLPAYRAWRAGGTPAHETGDSTRVEQTGRWEMGIATTAPLWVLPPRLIHYSNWAMEWVSPPQLGFGYHLRTTTPGQWEWVSPPLLWVSPALHYDNWATLRVKTRMLSVARRGVSGVAGAMAPAPTEARVYMLGSVPCSRWLALWRQPSVNGLRGCGTHFKYGRANSMR